ncbi:MAG: ABC transporter substrate-binding protein [Alphaproteobacteria bacterium]|jgi:microcin C transport system substrate-binding protein|nr:ABC transporter substrate-binding protein [Alphaproteobacteria bacterium]
MATRFAAVFFGLTALMTGAVAFAQDDAPKPALSEKERACLAKLKPAEVVNDRVVRSHAIAMHGKAKYGPDFKHFDYVNPDAPVGGTLRLATEGSFDSFNPFIPKGDAANPGVFETLLTSSEDEAFTEYGLIAESIEYPEDRSWVIFHLRPEARWHDGKPITPEDVIFSLETLRKEGQPFYRYYYGSVKTAEKVGDRAVKFSFGDAANLELPLIIGQLAILPKHWWEGRDFAKTLLDPPLGSGPYKVGEFEPGRFMERVRVDDYWGKDLPVNRGKNNFERIRTDYYRDRIAIREAVKAGAVDFFAENQAKAWAVDWDTPAVREERLIKTLVQQRTPQGMQAFVLNTRRARFQDSRVRQAITLAFDFEWTNQNLFYGQYKRTDSFFANSELAATGAPSGEELAILECLRKRLPRTVFWPPIKPPETDGTGWPRENLRKAFALLKEAGYEVRDLKLVNVETGEPFRFEILLVSPAFERIVLPFKRNLARLGIDARVRLVDQSQYINRLRQYDFDSVISGWGQSESPGNEQRDYWGSAAANRPGGRNLIGIAQPEIDALIELLIEAPDRDSLVARTRALDRVLLAGHWVVPNWHIAAQRIVYWDIFGRPKNSPYKGVSIMTWWLDPAKAGAKRNKS